MYASEAEGEGGRMMRRHLAADRSLKDICTKAGGASTGCVVQMAETLPGNEKDGFFEPVLRPQRAEMTHLRESVAAVTLPALCRLSARSLASLIARREVSVREVCTAYLAHIAAANPRVNAIVSLRPSNDILVLADAADRAVAAGGALGPLHGLPLAVKDTADTAGLRTTYGSPLFADHVPAQDGLMVSRLRQAGAIFIGKTNVPEFGLGSHSFNPVFGATGNAWDPTRSAGGSSGGAACGIALRMLPFADGSDFAGSLRNPAGFNNVLGLRPSQGRVPAAPREDAFYNQLTTEGPMARCANDLSLLLSVQSGYDPRAPLSLETGIANAPESLAADLRGRRIAWLGDLGGHLAIETGILPLCESALHALQAVGVRTDAVAPAFDWEELWRAFTVIRHFTIGGKFSAAYADAEKRRRMKPELQWEIQGFHALTAQALHRAYAVRTAWFDAAASLFSDYDYFALPTAQVFPFPIAERWPARIGGREMDSYHRWMEVVVPATMLGCPAISLPAGFGPGGLPVGVQIIGRLRADLSLLQLAHAHEQVTDFLKSAPPGINLT